MDVFTVSFFGHRHVENPISIEAELEKQIVRLLLEKQYVEFLVGRDGDFDLLVSSVIHRCKRTIRSDNSAHIWVMPYLKAEYRYNEEAFRDYYDEIEICSDSSQSHYKAAFQLRNSEMVDRSNLVVFYVSQKTGGAYQTMHYAKLKNVPYINLCAEPLSSKDKPLRFK